MQSTKLVWFAICYACFPVQSISKNQSILSVNSVKTEHLSLIKSVSEVIRKVFSPNFKTINIIEATRFSRRRFTKDFIDNILKESEEDLTFRVDTYEKVMNIKSRKKRNSVILLDTIETFRAFNKRLTADIFWFTGLFLFVLIDGKLDEHDEIFDTLWQKNIFNVDLVFEENNSISVMTFLPFANASKCGSTNPVLIDKYLNETFQRPADTFFPEKFGNLKNCPIKVITFENSLAVFKDRKPDGSYELLGYDMQMLNVLSKSLNFRVDLRLLEVPEPWGMVYSNGTVTNGLGELFRMESQIGVGNYFLKATRLSVLDSSVTYFNFPLVFVIPPGAHINSFQKLLQPFEGFVWILLLIIFGSSLMVIFVINSRFKKIKTFVFGVGVSHPIQNLLIIIFGSSQTRLPDRNFSRFIFMIFSLFCLVQRSIYLGSLYIFLQSDGLEREVQTLDEMIEKEFEFYTFESYIDDILYFPGIKNK